MLEVPPRRKGHQTIISGLQMRSRIPNPFTPINKYWTISLRTIGQLTLNRNILLSVFFANPATKLVIKVFDDKEPNFFFGYDIFFSALSVRLPFTPFEVKCLDFINVAPTQLHPNSWAFVQAFEVLMEFLGTVPSIGVLFSLFHVKDVEKGKWISLSGQPRRKIFDLFTSNFKHFND